VTSFTSAETTRPTDTDPDSSPRRPPAASGTGWASELDARAVDVVRALAMDAVQAAGSGHPGTAMSLAPAAYLLFQELIRHDPVDVDWPGRDRFVLSCGHSPLTLYIQLFLSGYGLGLEDLKLYRQWGSRTPGHPEHGHTLGVDITTGPLGQGIASAVGMALAARRVRGLFDPDPGPGQSIFDHTIWVIASDGDMEEGVQAEAASLAGHQQLGNLVVLYDDNHISIEGDTDVAFSEDVLARYAAYGWHTQRVADSEDVGALRTALQAARDDTGRPSIVAMRSIIAWPAPHAQNTAKAHGSALGADEVAATKTVLGLDPEVSFQLPAVCACPHPAGHRPGPGRPRRVEHSPHGLERGEPRTVRHSAADRVPPVTPRLGKRPAGVRPRPHGYGDPGRFGPGTERSGAGAARAVGRLG